jgi:hypothetical protein
MKYTKDTNYLDAISKADLSLISKRVYLERIKTICTKMEKDVYWVLKNPKEVTEFIFKLSEAESTRKSYISAILAIYKHNEGLRDTPGFNNSYKEWLEIFKELDDFIEERYKLNKPSDKQLEGYVKYQDIIKKRDELEHGTLEKLLLGFYTYIKPLRADFNNVHIYKKFVATPKYDNYILMNEKKLVLQEFKTQKKHDKLEIDIPNELITELENSLKKRPREWLFTDKEGNPYKSNSFTKWANRTFQRLFKKPLTITLIRHSYISSLDQNKLTTKEKEEIAHAMGHTKGMQELYRFV